MHSQPTAPDALYQVIANCEDELAAWPASGPPLSGWRAIGVIGTRDDCLDCIRRIDNERNAATLRRVLEQGMAG